MRDLSRRPEAVLDDAPAHHVEMRLRQLEDRGALRDMAERHMDAARLDGRECPLERRELRPRVRLVPVIRRREMGEYPLKHEPRQPRDIGGELRRLLRADADAPHARLDLEMHLGRPALRHSRRRERRRELPRADRLRDVIGDNVRRLLRQDQSEQQDRLREALLAQLDALRDRRDRQIRRAVCDGDARARDGAVSVGIRLHHHTEPRPPPHTLLDLLDILRIRGEIDLRPSGTIRHRNLPLSISGRARTLRGTVMPAAARPRNSACRDTIISGNI